MKVTKRALILTAGIVWLIAGLNVGRIGIIAYGAYGSWVDILLSLTVFLLFGMMFYKMAGKHVRRIKKYEEEYHSIFRFFDVKSYCIMIFMMTGGIGLRYSGWVPMHFIAVFYTGLGIALALAGVVFLRHYIKYEESETVGL